MLAVLARNARSRLAVVENGGMGTVLQLLESPIHGANSDFVLVALDVLRACVLHGPDALLENGTVGRMLTQIKARGVVAQPCQLCINGNRGLSGVPPPVHRLQRARKIDSGSRGPSHHSVSMIGIL